MALKSKLSEMAVCAKHRENVSSRVTNYHTSSFWRTCPPFWHCGTVKTRQIKLTQKVWDVSAKTTACGRNGPFFALALHLILDG